MTRKLLHRTCLLAFAGALALGITAGSASAAILLNETFSYPDGPLPSGSQVWFNHSGTGDTIQVVLGAAVLSHGAGSREDANRLFAARTASDITYACFKFRQRGTPAPTLFAAGDYFAHFRRTTDFIFPARLYVAAPTGLGFRLGISATSSGTTPTVFWGSDLALDAWHTIVVRFNAATGSASVKVNPTTTGGDWVTSPGAGAAIGAIVDSYALRQGTGNTCLQDVDDLVVGETLGDIGLADHVPGANPMAMALLSSLMLGAGALFVVRRRVLSA